MGLPNDPTDPHAVEQLRRSIAMLRPEQPASIERARAIRLLDELSRLQAEHRLIAAQLGEILSRLESPVR